MSRDLKISDQKAEKFISPYGELPIEEIRLARDCKCIIESEPIGPTSKNTSLFWKSFKGSTLAHKTPFKGDLFSEQDQVFCAHTVMQGQVGDCWLLAPIMAISAQKYGLKTLAGAMRDLSEPYPPYTHITMVQEEPSLESLTAGKLVIKKNKDGTLTVYWRDKIGKKAEGVINISDVQELKNLLDKEENLVDTRLIHKIVKLSNQSNTMSTLGDHLRIRSNAVIIRLKNLTTKKPNYLLLDKSIIHSDARAQSAFFIQILEKAFASALGGDWKNLWGSSGNNSGSIGAFNALLFNENTDSGVEDVAFQMTWEFEKEQKELTKFIVSNNTRFIREIKFLSKKALVVKEINSTPFILEIFAGDEKLAKEFINLFAKKAVHNEDLMKYMQGKDIEICELIEKIIKIFEEDLPPAQSNWYKLKFELESYLAAIVQQDIKSLMTRKLRAWLQPGVNNNWPMVFSTKSFSGSHTGLNSESITPEGFIGNHAFMVKDLNKIAYHDISEGFYEKLFLVELKDEKNIATVAKALFEKHGVDKVFLFKSDKDIYVMDFSMKTAIKFNVLVEPFKVLTELPLGIEAQSIALSKLSGENCVKIIREIMPYLTKEKKETKAEKRDVLHLQNPWGNRGWFTVSENGIAPRQIPSEQGVRGSTLVKLGERMHQIPEFVTTVSTLPLEDAAPIMNTCTRAEITFAEASPQKQSGCAMKALQQLALEQEKIKVQQTAELPIVKAESTKEQKENLQLAPKGYSSRLISDKASSPKHSSKPKDDDQQIYVSPNFDFL